MAIKFVKSSTVDLPSGKFATNALILELGALAYNVLPLMGQLGLDGFLCMSPLTSMDFRVFFTCRVWAGRRSGRLLVRI